MDYRVIALALCMTLTLNGCQKGFESVNPSARAIQALRFNYEEPYSCEIHSVALVEVSGEASIFEMGLRASALFLNEEENCELVSISVEDHVIEDRFIFSKNGNDHSLVGESWEEAEWICAIEDSGRRSLGPLSISPNGGQSLLKQAIHLLDNNPEFEAIAENESASFIWSPVSEKLQPELSTLYQMPGWFGENEMNSVTLSLDSNTGHILSFHLELKDGKSILTRYQQATISSDEYLIKAGELRSQIEDSGKEYCDCEELH